MAMAALTGVCGYFIGGPMAGERRKVDAGLAQIQCPVFSCKAPVAPTFEELSRFKVGLYNLHRLKVGVDVLHLYVFEDLTLYDAMQQLLDSYANSKVTVS